ncbi:ANTAR domain-containing protein [Streptomyces sp. NPDC059788]|uniref:ANTAR domain-containing protein n=1 Tax=Streptomyces sp. NPDC059788 TaxID=3346948 RepID=UPI00366596F9
MPEAVRWTSALPGSAAESNANGGAPDGPTPYLSWIAARDGGRTGVAVRGELDLDACERIEHELDEALRCSTWGVDLYLDAVSFCDCACLNMLLRLRQRAFAQGKTVVVRSCGRAVERLLGLTEARKLFIFPDPGSGHDALSTANGPAPHESTRQDLPTEIAQLRRAMQTRPAIDLARGILMATFSLSPEAAWAVLVTASQNTNTKLHRLAQDLVNSVQGAALPEAVQGQLGAAVAKAKAAPETSAVPERQASPERQAPPAEPGAAAVQAGAVGAAGTGERVV